MNGHDPLYIVVGGGVKVRGVLCVWGVGPHPFYFFPLCLCVGGWCV
jgi:hypothetical protein